MDSNKFRIEINIKEESDLYNYRANIYFYIICIKQYF